MTRYTVVWHQEAHDRLASIWLDANDRQSVTMAANAIDQHLVNDAHRQGEPVDDDLRELMVPPLRVIFAASEVDRLVRIVQVTD